MSPRGVAIPDLRERLFAAAERVAARDGAAALTSRAITAEAGCAKGVLHTHFAGLDGFVAELVLDRFARSARQAQALEAKVGHATVAENLQDVVGALLDSLPPAVVGLAITRPAAAAHTRDGLQSGAPAFDAIQHAVASYLQAEQHAGRIPADSDAATIALALVGTTHHLLMTGSPEQTTDSTATVERLLAALLPR
ncbi:MULTISPECIES: TetR/AcrR family transcriptional regulator [unclassified Streptomyces]|uniref:TetR/AcrR family transcriptional regulator n=1 Tax=unclassified Streptomyces TaxID=2593676 RepID=UPI000DAEEE38|nr:MULTISPECIES: TetR/AcrR family transcriptional regulator [unclassified Streptomyces]PZT73360.1 TetR/AcrR family transcriptional regulator [Streptomyces sp. AC1-42T]PZT83652.1 TetR/AcrR family transcriptional regulator [Streptomyces sp. AC1-42W]